ncbi:protein-S-isoprenylcysteine O-methyltransferase [Rhizobiaceae bacterium]|nr:protein-S-isoprenylcysteine O-methyltransferase [Rhizobiaceae bacterium]
MNGATLAGAIIWGLMLAGWLAIRLPYRRRAKRLGVVADRRSLAERALLGGTIVGLVIVPLFWIATGFPDVANYAITPWQVALGLLAAAGFLWLFRASHKQLARNWSVTLELREDHELVTSGLYQHIRHPMYASFWLWGIAQALLLGNWIAGLAGLFSVALLYTLRVGKEEAMMRAHFGRAYDLYCEATPRLVPNLFR